MAAAIAVAALAIDAKILSAHRLSRPCDVSAEKRSPDSQAVEATDACTDVFVTRAVWQ